MKKRRRKEQAIDWFVGSLSFANFLIVIIMVCMDKSLIIHTEIVHKNKVKELMPYISKV